MMQQKILSPGSKLKVFLRSVVYFSLVVVLTIVFPVIMLVCAPFVSFSTSYKIANCWVRAHLWLLKTICGLRHDVRGLENIPKVSNGIIFSKHQSAWETIAMQRIFPPQVFILKKELLRMPFFGWALATCNPIAINRSSKREALNQVIEQGTQRLNDRLWVVIFPEGTRISPGEKGKYGGGGALLAQKSGYPVVPVAHNAGEFWGKNSFLKHPGVIQVRIGPVIMTQGRRASEIAKEAEAWIEMQMAEISGIGPNSAKH